MTLRSKPAAACSYVGNHWDFLHQAPGASSKLPGIMNVMPDLAVAMKQNPNLKGIGVCA